MTERWLPIPEYEDYYEVSDHGRVRSLDRWVPTKSGGRQLRRGKLLTQFLSPGYGYWTVNLSVNAVMSPRHVHTLVLEAFVGSRPPGSVSRHGRGGQFDNRLANLRYGSSSDNAQDCVREGNHREQRKVECPRGHGLCSPNLEPSTKRRTDYHRKCYACSLTRVWAMHRGIPPDSPDWIDEANRRYAEILHFDGPIYYNRNPAKQIYGSSRWQPPMT